MSDPFLKDVAGEKTTLAKITGKRPTLFIFVRHFG